MTEYVVHHAGPDLLPARGREPIARYATFGDALHAVEIEILLLEARDPLGIARRQDLLVTEEESGYGSRVVFYLACGG